MSITALVQALAAQVGAKPTTADVPPPPPADQRLTGPELYQQTLRSVAWVKTASTQRATGWLLDRSRRLLLTTYKVANRQDEIEVIFPIYRKDKLLSPAMKEFLGVLKSELVEEKVKR